jgi:hypothetical protein
VVLAGAAVVAGALPELELELLDDPQPAVKDASAADATRIPITRCMGAILGI